MLNDPPASAVPGIIPKSHEDLLRRPLFAHLATQRPDGTLQVNPMWSQWDGRYLYFTTSTQRQKHRNVTQNPNVAISINDPDAPYRYLEVRGNVVRIDPDPNADFFAMLADRYELDIGGPPGDAPHRVVLAVEPTTVSYQ